jgi:hypothetical protein
MRNPRIAAASMGLLFAAAIAAPIQAQPKDVNGWGKITWGMSFKDAAALYPGSSMEERGPNWSVLSIGEVAINPALSVKVTLSADKDSHITGVLLTPTGAAAAQSSGVPVPGAKAIRRMAFEDIKKLLIEKYGAPKSDDDRVVSGFERRRIFWAFPSSSIELYSSESVRYDIGHLGVQYKATTANPL